MTTLDEAVNRFLRWRLPDDFAPDGGISFTEPPNQSCWPVGTNLLTAVQAKQMLGEVLGILPLRAVRVPETKIPGALARQAPYTVRVTVDDGVKVLVSEAVRVVTRGTAAGRLRVHADRLDALERSDPTP